MDPYVIQRTLGGRVMVRPHVPAEARLPRFTEPLRPVVDGVARIPAGIQRKLFVGFIGGVMLLVSMAIISLVVIAEMDERNDELNRHSQHARLAQQMLYQITAQSHFRTMALLDPDNRTLDAAERPWHERLLASRETFGDRLEEMERSVAELPAEEAPEIELLAEIRRTNEALVDHGLELDDLYMAGDYDTVRAEHIDFEHPLSHDVEDPLRQLVDLANQDIEVSLTEFSASHDLLRNIVVVFSVFALAAALLAGFALSWSIILPVRKMEHALAGMNAGKFRQHVEVPNRDEFGQLARDLNRTSARLALLFSQQKALARRLTDTNLSLVRANQAKSRFLASVSHELRTPMNAILGFTEALLAGMDGPLNDDQRTSLGWVQRGARDLLGLINEILDLSKIESGKLVIEAQPFDPRELVESVVAQHRSLAAQKGLRLTWRDDGAPDRLVQDRQRVRQILSNLLGNALKFTEQGGVDVVAAAAEDGGLLVQVSDTGPGIPVDQQEEIFEEFRTANREAGGTGLGLAISRRLARAMGGEVTLDSSPGRGSTFRVALPPTFVAPAQAAASRGPTSGSGQTQVLLSIDDDPSVAPLLAKMLGPDGYQVVGSQNPASAVDDVRRLRPAAVLLDALMPEKPGADVLQELKTDPDTLDIPVVVVSVVDAGDVPEGADGYVGKPIRREDLLVALEHARSLRAAAP